MDDTGNSSTWPGTVSCDGLPFTMVAMLELPLADTRPGTVWTGMHVHYPGIQLCPKLSSEKVLGCCDNKVKFRKHSYLGSAD